jgi:hypothetical protein
MYHCLPDALAPAEQDEIEMLVRFFHLSFLVFNFFLIMILFIAFLQQTLDIDAAVQAQLTTLMALYSDFSINGRECMGCLNIENPDQAMSISHLGFNIWANDLVSSSQLQSCYFMKPRD